MPRTKSYTKVEVTQKAMNLFWKNGFKTSSMQLLEKEMGINKFSIYASFGSKEGLLEESLKLYAQKLSSIIEKLEESEEGIDAIKIYFYDFKKFSIENNMAKGCLVTNTANEMMDVCNDKVKSLLVNSTNQVRNAFAQKLIASEKFSNQEVEQIADYLMVAMAGFSSATKMFSEKQVANYLNLVFKNL